MASAGFSIFRLYDGGGGLVVDAGVGRDGLDEPDAAADLGVVADRRLAAEDRRVRVDDHVVLDVRMALEALHERSIVVLREGEASERHALVEPHVASDDRRLPDDDAGAVVYEEPLADRRARMDVDAGLGVGELGHDAREDRDLELV